jgi:hypothetical protein
MIVLKFISYIRQSLMITLLQFILSTRQRPDDSAQVYLIYSSEADDIAPQASYLLIRVLMMVLPAVNLSTRQRPDTRNSAQVYLIYSSEA